MFPLFEDNRSDSEKQLDELHVIHQSIDSANGLETAIMSLAVLFKKQGLNSCTNDLVECAIVVRKCAGVMVSLFQDGIEDLKNGD